MAEWGLFFGSLMTAFGPIAALFLMVVAQRAQLVIVAITSAFFYLLGLLVAATIWTIITPLQTSIQATIPIAIVLQEIFRYLFFVVYVRCELAVKKVTTKQNQLPLNDVTTSFASGVGFALMRALMLYGTVLAASVQGEGAAFTDTCPSVPLVFSSALSTLALTLMDVALMIVAFEGFRKKSIPHIAAVVLIHLGSGLSNLLNLNEVGCKASIPLTFVAAALAIIAASLTIKRSSTSSF